MQIKIQFHTHTRKDPVDNIKHTEEDLIAAAAANGYDALSITCHNRVVFDENLQKYAEKNGILLIPGIEKSIGRRHVLIINANAEAEKIKTFDDLKNYKKNRAQCLIIAPHPFYPTWICLHKKLEENIKLFDAVEYSWFHSKKLNFYNEKAKKFALKHGLPMISTSDNHILKYLDASYSLVEAKEKSIPAIFDAIKKNRIRIVSKNIPIWRLITSLSCMELRFLAKRL